MQCSGNAFWRLLCHLFLEILHLKIYLSKNVLVISAHGAALASMTGTHVEPAQTSVRGRGHKPVIREYTS